MKKLKIQTNCGTQVWLENSTIYKKFNLDNFNDTHYPSVKKMIIEYHESLVEAKIAVPDLISCDDSLNFSFSYCGKSIVSLMNKNPANFFAENEAHFFTMIKSIKKAAKHNILFDPHIKNFTILNDDLYYVDIFPPYSEDYLNLLVLNFPKFGKDLTNLFNIFSPSMVMHHFLSDFKKTFPKENKLMLKLGEIMINERFIENIDFSLIDYIISLEEEAYQRNPLPLF